MVGNRKFHCWKRYGYGYIDLNEAIASSCNTYSYNMRKLICVDSLLEMASEFGLCGGRLIKRFKGEASGLIPNKNWREQNLCSGWQVGGTINSFIGQGYTLTTPHTTCYTCSENCNRERNLSSYYEWHNNTKLQNKVNHLNMIRDAMFKTVYSSIGLAYNWQLRKIEQVLRKKEYQDRNHKLIISSDSSGYAISRWISRSRTISTPRLL